MAKTNEESRLLWRTESFRALGFSRRKSEELAKTKMDLPEARNLHAAGCSLDLIERILAPLDEPVDTTQESK